MGLRVKPEDDGGGEAYNGGGSQVL